MTGTAVGRKRLAAERRSYQTVNLCVADFADRTEVLMPRAFTSGMSPAKTYKLTIKRTPKGPIVKGVFGRYRLPAKPLPRKGGDSPGSCTPASKFLTSSFQNQAITPLSPCEGSPHCPSGSEPAQNCQSPRASKPFSPCGLNQSCTNWSCRVVVTGEPCCGLCRWTETDFAGCLTTDSGCG